MQLPDDLRAALESAARDASPRELAAAVSALSGRYRGEGERSGEPLVRSPTEALAYAIYRVPATYGAIAAALHEVRSRRADLSPGSVLDVGAGPGTAVWAAAETWPSLREATALERDRHMIRLGRELAASSTTQMIRQITWEVADVTHAPAGTPSDVTIAAYMAGELPQDSLDSFARRLWERTDEASIVVEPGTPRGFATITRLSDVLAAAGAHIVAPFPHDWRCVESPEDWCHFSARVPRARSHRQAKRATLSYEDEKYTYVAASRRRGRAIAARVIRHPQVRPGLVGLVVCTAEGVRRLVITRKQGAAYRRARDLRWGSAIEPEEADLFGLG